MGSTVCTDFENEQVKYKIRAYSAYTKTKNVSIVVPVKVNTVEQMIRNLCLSVYTYR